MTVDELVSTSTGTENRRRVLFLADDDHCADVVTDHIRSIAHQSQHDITVVNPIRNRRAWTISGRRYDVVLIHYSICIVSDYHLPERVAEALKSFSGPKIQIVQDEMRWVDRMTRRMRDLEINAVFSSLEPENIFRVYHHDYIDRVQFISSLPGYVSDRLRDISAPPLSQRPFDLIYRGRPLPVWLGKFSQEKVDIGVRAVELAKTHGLDVDCKTREEDRVYGRSWNEFLMSGRATLATEGGASVFDFDGTIEAGVNAYREAHPNAGDEEVWRAVVEPYEGNIVHKTITPRVFEAIMCRTALVMYPGRYRDVLQPWEHYIPLERDGSNSAEVARWIRDDRRLGDLVERAYRRIATDERLQFSNYVAAMDFVIDELRAGPETAGSSSLRSAASSAFVACCLPAVGAVERRLSAFENPHTVSGRSWNKIKGTVASILSTG